MIIITNNPAVHDSHRLATIRNCEIVYMTQATYTDVLIAVRDRVHMGHRLLTHPLSGSVKPHETPYESVAISQQATTLDMQSLTMVEDAIVVAKTAARSFAERKPLDEKKLQDFQVIDRQLIENALV